MRLQLRSGVRVEEVGDEVIVLDRSGAVVHRVSGETAEALVLVGEGFDAAETPARLADAMASLQDAGLVVAGGLSRRKLLLAGGVATAGITTFALATPAAAISVCPSVTPTANQLQQYTTAGSDTFVTGPHTNSVRVRLWGGGGGPGMRSSTQSGGGGGGGGYTSAAVPVSVCTSYTVVVGGGGVPATANNVQNPGGPSQFNQGVTVLLQANGGTGGLAAAGGAGGTASAIGNGYTGFVSNAGGTGGSRTGGMGGGGGGGSAGHGGVGGPGGSTNTGTGGTAGTAGPDGGGAGAPGAAGGKGGTIGTNSGNADPGVAPGGGGGSNADNGAGGNGAVGKAVVYKLT